jgi:hypothetical protein
MISLMWTRTALSASSFFCFFEVIFFSRFN